MNKIYLSLGSNLGDRFYYIEKAREMINEYIGKIILESAIYETEAWGDTSQSDFLNMCVMAETRLDPENLLIAIKEIEDNLGRKRNGKWQERTIDIDILFFNDRVISLPGLTIPHPHLQNRNFVLTPLSEIASEFIHPVLNRSIGEIKTMCMDNQKVRTTFQLIKEENV